MLLLFNFRPWGRRGMLLFLFIFVRAVTRRGSHARVLRPLGRVSIAGAGEVIHGAGEAGDAPALQFSSVGESARARWGPRDGRARTSISRTVRARGGAGTPRPIYVQR
jgi:hypothetical protein